MKPKQFLQYLRSQGVQIEQGGIHIHLSLNGNRTQMSRSTKDVDNVKMNKIKKNLGIK